MTTEEMMTLDLDEVVSSEVENARQVIWVCHCCGAQLNGLGEKYPVPFVVEGAKVEAGLCAECFDAFADEWLEKAVQYTESIESVLPHCRFGDVVEVVMYPRTPPDLEKES